MNSQFRRIVPVALVVLSAGCSSSDDNGPPMIPVGTCAAALTPCGGDIVGTWSLASACTDGSLTELLNQQTAADYPSCANSFTTSSMESRAKVTYDGTRYTRTGTVHTTAKMEITAACLAEQIPGLTLTAASCSNLAKVLPQMYENTIFACNYDGTTCNCDMDSNEAIDESGTYSITGTTITESTGSATYAYCVNGSSMSQGMRFQPSGITGLAELKKQ